MFKTLIYNIVDIKEIVTKTLPHSNNNNNNNFH